MLQYWDKVKKRDQTFTLIFKRVFFSYTKKFLDDVNFSISY